MLSGVVSTDLWSAGGWESEKQSRERTGGILLQFNNRRMAVLFRRERDANHTTAGGGHPTFKKRAPLRHGLRQPAAAFGLAACCQ